MPDPQRSPTEVLSAIVMAYEALVRAEMQHTRDVKMQEAARDILRSLVKEAKAILAKH